VLLRAAAETSGDAAIVQPVEVTVAPFTREGDTRVKPIFNQSKIAGGAT